MTGVVHPKRRRSELSTSRYRGEDRRGTSETSTAPLGRSFAVAGVLLLLAMVGLSVGPLLTDAVGVVDEELLRIQFDAAAIAVALVVGTLCFVRWRLTGEAASLYLTVAWLLFGIGTVGVGYMLTHLTAAGGDPLVFDWVHPASRLSVFGLLFLALRAPTVDSRLRLWRVMGLGLALTAVVATVLQVFPQLTHLVTSGADRLVETADGRVHPGSVVLALSWLALGVAFGLRGIRRQRWLFAWFGLCFFALAFTELLRVPANPPGSLWLGAASLMRLVGLLCAVMGITRELVRSFGEQQGYLLDSVLSGLTQEARLEAEQRALEERAHEARNALTAIEGAARTLEYYRDRLDEDTRQELSTAITREIARLQQLVSAEHVLSKREHFSLFEIVGGIVTAARSHGTVVHVDVPSDFNAYGRPGETAQVLQNLVENARRYAPGSPISLRGERLHDGVLLRVEDEGPGIAPEERGRVFQRGQRGSTAGNNPGTGLGLYVSSQLMREQGGDLWVDERAGGGASFAVWLPDRAGSAGVVEQAVDEPEHVSEPADGTSLLDT